MQASDIDWSKAPEGATHYLPADGVINACWYILNEDRMAVMLAGKKDEWSWRNIDSHDREILIPRAIPRPASTGTWNGAGLPPVGTVCEVNCSGWRRCEVFAHKVEGDSDPDVLFSHTRDDGWPAWNWARDQSRFRPIRTPEQIATDERDRAVDAMMETFMVTGSVKSTLRSACLALYDAGYRKVEGDKQ